MSEASDDELMARVVEEDRAAFSILLNRHLTSIHAFIFRMTRNEADADDLVQETFLRVWKNAHTWRPGEVKFTTWSHRIARNACIDAFRKRRETADVDLDTLSDPNAETDMQAQTQLASALNDALQSLPERQRTAIVLCHHQGFSNKEAAETLDVTVDALESLLARARRTLRRSLTAFQTATT